jgi:hypothetical protein
MELINLKGETIDSKSACRYKYYDMIGCTLDVYISKKYRIVSPCKRINGGGILYNLPFIRIDPGK